MGHRGAFKIPRWQYYYTEETYANFACATGEASFARFTAVDHVVDIPGKRILTVEFVRDVWRFRGWESVPSGYYFSLP